MSQFSVGLEQSEKVRMQNRASDLARIAPGRKGTDKASPAGLAEADLLGGVDASKE